MWALLLLLPCLALGGCATSSVDRWYQAQDTLTTTRNAILIQHGAGNISDEDLVVLDGYEKAVRRSLAVVKEMLDDPDSDPQQLEFYLDLADRVLDQLIQYLASEGAGDTENGNVHDPVSSPGGSPGDGPDRSGSGQIDQPADREGGQRRDVDDRAERNPFAARGPIRGELGLRSRGREGPAWPPYITTDEVRGRIVFHGVVRPVGKRWWKVVDTNLFA
jgi:hypothetical protein